jgi:predicted RNA-binding Zn-ribbon protein involved in translation (DUF1610 family)
MSSENDSSHDESSSLPLEQLTCEGCGRSLAGLRVANCPDCGRPVGPFYEDDEGRIFETTAPPRVPTHLDMGGAIPAEWDLRCVHCGYSLTGLTERVCPECGQRFQPRATWLANRLPSRKEVVRRTLTMLAGVGVWAIGAYFFPLWLLPLPVWLIFELLCIRFDWNPLYIRVVFGIFYILWMMLIPLISP